MSKIDSIGDVKEVVGTEELLSCWTAFKQLRPHLFDSEELVSRWTEQRGEGYRVVYVEKSGSALAVAGFRILTTMAWGRVLYVDDLVALEDCRGQGLGAHLLTWLKAEAANRKCRAVHLDTGYQRHAAHKSYLRNGFQLNCHHLACDIERQ